MHLTFKKGFDGDLEKLPKKEVPGAVQFREYESMEKLSLIANLLAIVIAVICAVPVFFAIKKTFQTNGFEFGLWQIILLFVLEIVTIPVHECLHASMFRGEVEFYTYLKKRPGLCGRPGGYDKRPLRDDEPAAQSGAGHRALHYFLLCTESALARHLVARQHRIWRGRLYQYLSRHYADAQRQPDVHERDAFILVHARTDERERISCER